MNRILPRCHVGVSLAEHLSQGKGTWLSSAESWTLQFCHGAVWVCAASPNTVTGYHTSHIADCAKSKAKRQQRYSPPILWYKHHSYRLLLAMQHTLDSQYHKITAFCILYLQRVSCFDQRIVFCRRPSHSRLTMQACRVPATCSAFQFSVYMKYDSRHQ